MYGRGHRKDPRQNIHHVRTAPTPQFDALQAAHLARIERELAQKPQTTATVQAA
jgi:hypothetical protein